MPNSSSSYSATLGKSSQTSKDLTYVFRLAWIGMLSGVVIEKIQEANKVSTAYKRDDSIDEDRKRKIKVEQKINENPQNV